MYVDVFFIKNAAEDFYADRRQVRQRLEGIRLKVRPGTLLISRSLCSTLTVLQSNNVRRTLVTRGCLVFISPF